MDTKMNLEVKVSSAQIVVENIKEKTMLAIDRQGIDQDEKSFFYSYGVYGMVAINQSSYLIFVVDAVEKGLMQGHAVYEIREVEVIVMRRGDSETFLGELSNLKRFFNGSGIYFSVYPLYKTLSIRKDEDMDFLFNLLPLKRFFKYAGEDGIPFSIYCIQGFFGLFDTESISLRLISRRSWRRTGARYFCRGSNSLGYVSNYVETEQIIYDGKRTVSYLQIRGSIPLIWEHVLGREYNPKILVDSKKILHVADKVLEEKYGEVLYLNLIRNSGYEKVLYDVYERELAEGDKKSIHFNFSEEGGLLEGSSRRKFLKLIEETLSAFGYFDFETFQSGVIRTNCIDCLDRTNIAQFIIGRVVFGRQIARFDVKDKKGFYDQLKFLWRDNGNLLSMQYSGSFALKTYFLSNEKQGILGSLRDGLIGLKRYFVNRFYHGGLQTTYDILTTECEGKTINVYRDGVSITKRVSVASLLITWLVTWISTGSISLRPFFWSTLTTVFIIVITMIVFLDFFIQKPRYIGKQY